MVDDYISVFLADYADLAGDFMAFFGGFFVAGVLLCFVLWAIAYTVHAVYAWLSAWGTARD